MNIAGLAYLLITIAYVATGKLGMLLALPPGYASPIFLPAGIAVAAALIGGRKTLPWIFLGSLLLNIWIGYSASLQVDALGVAVAMLIAFASLLQAGVGGLILRRTIGYPSSLDRKDKFLRFLMLAPVICLVSASLSVSSLWALGIVDSAAFAANWGAWWFGDTLGVLVMLPLIMTVVDAQGSVRQSRLYTVTIPLLAVLSIGFIAVYFLQQTAFNSARKAQQDSFEYQAREIALRIEQRLATYEQVLRGAKGLFSASKSVDRGEFSDYVATQNLMERYPGIQGVGFSPIVSLQEKSRHIESMRKNGFPDYRIWPEGERQLYAPIVYLEPLAGSNLRALGYDVYSDSVRSDAMNRARDLNKTILSGKLRLVQETGVSEQPGFIMYLPVFRNGYPHASEAERRANVMGWVSAPFRMSDLMEGLLGDQAHNLDLEIFDGESAISTAQMYDSNSRQDQNSTPLYSTYRSIGIMGHTWTIRLHSLPKFEAELNTAEVTIVRISGISITLLLAVLVWQLAIGRTRALNLAQEMTRELRESEERLLEAQRISHLGNWTLDHISGKLFWSKEIFRVFEIDPHGFQPTYEGFLDAIHPEDRDAVNSAYTDSLRTRTPYEITHRLLMRDGRIKWVHERCQTSFDTQGAPVRSVGTVQDITEQQEIQQRIEHMAHYDTLTGLPNRALFFDRLRQALVLAKRHEVGLTLLYMDLDGFKKVNDTQGHHAGDMVLKIVAERMSACVRESDTVSRLGGDEFTIILNDAHKQEDIAAIAQKIINAISDPFDIDGSQAHIGISIGIARYTEDAGNEDELVWQADHAMYMAKMAGKNTYHVGIRNQSPPSGPQGPEHS